MDEESSMFISGVCGVHSGLGACWEQGGGEPREMVEADHEDSEADAEMGLDV